MINICFNITNPWSDTFKNLWCRAYRTPFKHKHIELEVLRYSTVVSFTFRWTVRQDHAGIEVEAGVLGYNIHFQFYDNRHWDPLTNQYYIHHENEL